MNFAVKKFFREFVIFKELIILFNEFCSVLWNKLLKTEIILKVTNIAYI